MSGPDNFDPMANVANAIRAQFEQDAATITALQAEVAALREALEPLSNIYEAANMNDPISDWLTIGHLANARAALERTKP